jgi:hypothetical protein
VVGGAGRVSARGIVEGGIGAGDVWVKGIGKGGTAVSIEGPSSGGPRLEIDCTLV